MRVKLDRIPEIPEIEMVSIPAGSFRMGNTSGIKSFYLGAKPAHMVRVDGFKMGKYEVTQELWLAVMGKNPSQMRGLKRPVEQVSWNDVQTFIRRLNQQTGRRFRLPSEAEWEYAARAGRDTSFSTGDCLSVAQANIDGYYKYGKFNKLCGRDGQGKGKTTPVGSYAPNGYGLYDMDGNVMEWLQDCAHRGKGYNGAPDTAVAWESGSCEERVLRGGAWSRDRDEATVYARFYQVPERGEINTTEGFGFRLAED